MKHLFFLPLILFTTPVFAADPGSGASNCLRLSQIDQTPVIDDRTILVKMKTGNDYRRIDLRGTCPSLRMSGFAHQTPSDDLCTSTVLTVRSPGASICTIERIVKIDRTEADALMARR